MSKFYFNCPHCNAKILCPEEAAGQLYHCPTCDGKIIPRPTMQTDYAECEIDSDIIQSNIVRRPMSQPLYGETRSMSGSYNSYGRNYRDAGRNRVNTVLVEKTSKQLKLCELIVTLFLFITLLAAIGASFVSPLLAVILWGVTGICFVAFIIVRIAVWWQHG